MEVSKWQPWRDFSEEIPFVYETMGEKRKFYLLLMSRELIDRIAEMLDQVSDENEFLYRISIDEIICRDPEFLDESTLEDIELNWKDYILLPTQYDIHEYLIMQDFAMDYPYEQMREKMLASLRGKGAFRRFKDTVFYNKNQ